MAQKILVTRFRYDLPLEEYRQIVDSLAKEFAEVPGCIWKIWLLDDTRTEGGAVYLFSNEMYLENFKASSLVASVLSHPALGDFDFRVCDILKEASEITRAPLAEIPKPDLVLL